MVYSAVLSEKARNPIDVDNYLLIHFLCTRGPDNGRIVFVWLPEA